jgi:hypothetical protein
MRYGTDTDENLMLVFNNDKADSVTTQFEEMFWHFLGT